MAAWRRVRRRRERVRAAQRPVVRRPVRRLRLRAASRVALRAAAGGLRDSRAAAARRPPRQPAEQRPVVLRGGPYLLAAPGRATLHGSAEARKHGIPGFRISVTKRRPPGGPRWWFKDVGGQS